MGAIFEVTLLTRLFGALFGRFQVPIARGTVTGMSDCTDEQFAAMEESRESFKGPIRPHVPTRGPQPKEIAEMGNTFMKEHGSASGVSSPDMNKIGETHDRALHDRADGMHAMTTPTNCPFIAQGPVKPHVPKQGSTTKARDSQGQTFMKDRSPSAMGTTVSSADRGKLGTTHDRGLHDRAEGLHAIDTATNNPFTSGTKIQPHKVMRAMTREDRNSQGNSYLRAGK